VDSGVVAGNTVRRAMPGPVDCEGPSGGRGMSKGLLRFVVTGPVLGNAGSGNVMFRHSLLSCGASSVIGVGVIGFRVQVSISSACFVVGGVVVVASSLSSIVGCGGVARLSVQVFASFSLLATVSGRVKNVKKSSSSASSSIGCVVVVVVES